MWIEAMSRSLPSSLSQKTPPFPSAHHTHTHIHTLSHETIDVLPHLKLMYTQSIRVASQPVKRQQLALPGNKINGNRARKVKQRGGMKEGQWSRRAKQIAP